ncbi:type I restriction enzyme EcoEI M protein [Filimonas sp.]|nr:type I restriction enzyme EcoEI M protein [Filimonas sp.]
MGDAFEYLLSVMGSQGDAGQFRTPRHIIDFVTACVNPQKNETVLDPACGTAGFLLSAYKHILNQNTDKRQGDKLKPDDRKKLATNFVGYDISPDMVRLSLANMYLHGFATPLIHEYDSLSSEDRWQETFDVILANPPFMTPKGGIRPHKKFGVQANKAEVLFTDYIAEHLNSNGRAGIVVPNGIVATSQTAYKQLRKMLVQDSLIAVISLPAGVFQPYSGVKTSVLILDKRLAKKSQHILFLKIENDGFDLGAQRREIDKNDLPSALQTLEAFKECLSNDRAFEDLPSLATLVEKEIVLGNKDVVLNADRYFEKELSQTEFELVKLDEVCEFKRGPFGGSLKKEIFVPDGYLVYEQYHAINDDFSFGRYFIDEAKFKEMIGFEVKPSDLLISCSGTMGRIAIVPENAKRGIINQALLKLTLDQSRILPLYLKKILEAEEVQERHFRNQEGAAIQNVASVKVLKEIEIPLPPLEIQQQIVAEIEGYQKIIDGAKQVVNNYKPTISINPDWEMVELGEVCDVRDGTHDSPKYQIEGYPLITSKNLKNGHIDFSDVNNISEEDLIKINKRSAVDDGDILMPMIGTIGNPIIVKKEREFAVKNVALIKPKPDSRVMQYFVNLILQTPLFDNYVEIQSKGSTQKFLSLGTIREFEIPIPPIAEQQTIVKAIEEEMQLVNANKRLIEIFEQKINTKIGEVWGVKEEVETI